ncbi:hypothetical protein ACFL51_00530 [Myxococcota bacterium]
MRSISLVTCLFVLPACGDSSSNDNNSQCEEGFRPEGPACVPIFDDCPGPAEIPVLGGGCQPVGVTECASGFESDGEGGCEPILPSEPCPPGTMEMIGHTECQPVGVIDCGDGFVSDGEGGCDAIFPTEPCPWGYMEILGFTECQPIGDCGTGTWGLIEIDATTVFVDASADATGADGSQGAPFVTIQEAYDVVVEGGQIAVAAGEYEERLVIDKEVRLTGRCAELVTVRGEWWLGQPRPPVTIGAGGSGSAVRGLTLTGDVEGLKVEDAVGISVIEAQIVGAGGIGLWARNAEISLVKAVAAANHNMGIFLIGTEAEISWVVIRDTLPQQSDGTGGYGLGAACDPDTGVCGSLRIDHALLWANHHIDLAIAGTGVEILSVVIRDTLPQQSDGTGNVGLLAACDLDTGVCGSLRIDHALLQANHSNGIALYGTEAEISSVVVRDTQPRQSDGTDGYGIYSECDPDVGVCGSLRLDHALLRANHAVGINLWGTEAEISSVIVRDTLPQQSDGIGGSGLQAVCDPNTGVCGSLRIDHALLRANHTTGMVLWSTEAEISSVVVRGTLPRQSDGIGGFGLSAACDPDVGICGSLRLDYALLRANREMAIALWDTETEIYSVVVRDTLPRHSDGTRGYGLHANCHPEWGVCGSLLVADSLIQRCEMLGIAIFNVPAELSGVAVKDTRQNQAGYFAGEFGNGIFALCDELTHDCATLDMTGCLVDSSFTAGVAVQRVSGSIQGSMISSVAPRAMDAAFGYGIQVEGVPGAPPTEFHVNNCLIQDAELAGILYYLAGGTVTSSQITGGQYTVVMNQGANPIIQDDNDLSGSIESEPTWSNMDPAPAPEPALPFEM